MGGLPGLLLCLHWTLFGALLYAQEASPAALPEGEGKDLVENVCSQCHGLRTIRLLRDGTEGWREVIERMVLHGAQLSSEDADTAARYLSAHFGPGPNPMRTGMLPPRTAQGSGVKEIALPAGAGKDLVEARCSICHDLGRIVSSKRSRADWELITTNMVGRGPQATPEQIRTIVSYLAGQFGKQTD